MFAVTFLPESMLLSASLTAMMNVKSTGEPMSGVSGYNGIDVIISEATI